MLVIKGMCVNVYAYDVYVYFAGVGVYGYGLAFFYCLYQKNHISLYLYPFQTRFISNPIIIHYIIMYCAIICILSLVTCNTQPQTSTIRPS